MMKKATIWVVVLSASLGVLRAQDLTEDELTQQRQLIEGQKLIMLEQYEDALNVLDKAYQSNKENSTVLWAISRVHLATGDLEKAQKSILRAIELNPENKYYLEHYTTILSRNRDYSALAETYGKLYEMDPSVQKYAFNQVKYLRRTKDFKSALKVLDELDGQKVDPAIVYRKALIYEELGQSKRAIKQYERMIEAFPEEVRYLHLLAAHYQSNQEQELAMETYERILTIDPDDTKAALAISQQVKETGNDSRYLRSIEKIIKSPSIAIDAKMKELIPYVQKLDAGKDNGVGDILEEYAQELVNIHPNEAKAFAFQGDVYNLRNKSTEAVDAFKEAIDLDPTVYLVWEQYMFGLAELDRMDELGKESERALDFFPNRGRVYFFAGLSAHQKHKQQKAYDHLIQASYMVGRDVRLKYDTYQLLGWVAHTLGKEEESEKYFDAAFEIHSEDPGFLAAFSQALSESGTNLEKAKGLLDQAIVLDPTHSSIPLAKAAWMIAQKDYDGAIQTLQASNEQYPSPGSWEKLGDAYSFKKEVENAEKAYRKALELNGDKKRLEKKIRDLSENSAGI